MNSVIQANELTKVFDNEMVIDSVNLSVTRGSIHAIVGPNGAGKSTLLKIMAGLIKPTLGSVRVFEDTIENGASLRQRVHYISPDVNLYPSFQVKDILKYGSLLYERWDSERSQMLTDAFALPVNKTVRKLSLGMKMRLRMVLAFSAHPDVLLIDEATNGIDPAAKEQVLDLILQESANRGVTVIMATHQLAEIERIADTVSVLVGGRIVSTSNIDSLKEQVYEVHTSLPGESDQVVERLLPDSVNHMRSGERLTFIWVGKRNENDLEVRLRAMGAGFVEMRPASLEQWFQAMLKKEGVASGKIVLPDRTPV